MSSLERAIQIATTAHVGQTDKAGASYIDHPLHVMSQLDTDTTRVVAVLHDLVEDTEWTLEGLREEGFSDEIVAALDCLTHREGELYDDYITRIAANALAVKVKFADLAHNLDSARLVCVTEKDELRIEKYKGAVVVLNRV